LSVDSTVNRTALPGLIALLLSSAVSQAHRLPEGLTTVSYNPTTASTEIVHRLHVHDAETGLAEIMQNAQFTLGTLESQARFALYVEQRFTIRDNASGTALTLVLVGAELEGDQVLVFQEVAGALPFRVAMRNDILREVYPDQVNKVNVVLDTGVRTLIFSGEDEWKDLHLLP
jgi:hypothetical protein